MVPGHDCSFPDLLLEISKRFCFPEAWALFEHPGGETLLKGKEEKGDSGAF